MQFFRAFEKWSPETSKLQFRIEHLWDKAKSQVFASVPFTLATQEPYVKPFFNKTAHVLRASCTQLFYFRESTLFFTESNAMQVPVSADMKQRSAVMNESFFGWCQQ